MTSELPTGAGPVADGDIAGLFLDLLADANVPDLLDELVLLATTQVPGATCASVTMVGERGPMTVAASDDRAARMDAVQYAGGRGPCLTAATEGVMAEISVIGGDLGPEWADAARDTGLASSLSLPLVSGPELSGSLNLYSDAPQRPAWPGRSVAVADMLVAYAAEAIEIAQRMQDLIQHNRRLAAEFGRIQVVGQAAGIVMAQQGCTSAEAHDHLVRSARTAQLSLERYAEHLIAQISRVNQISRVTRVTRTP